MSDTKYREWEKLRSLLVGEERKMIEQIIERLDNFDIQAEEISELLPEAIRRSLKNGNKLNQAFIPLLNESFKQSIKQNPNELTDALYALIGPATRKSVAEALKSMMQSFNQAMQSIFSWDGLKWRIEAIMTGKSFSEVVLLHTLVYQVEQVFLIHNETGLLLESAKLDTAFAQDPDMVSSMLRAIQDFVHDSFQLDESESLNTMNVGELTVWVEDCPNAVLALVIRGNAPESLRHNFAETIEFIYTQYRKELQNFEGDTEPFEYVKPDLEALLYQKTTDEKKSDKPLIAISIVSLIIAALLFWAGWEIWEAFKWSGFKDKLESQPGFILLDDGYSNGKRYISGFKEEFAEYPDDLWGDTGYDSSEVNLLLEPYSSMKAEFVEKRAMKILKAPETVNFKYIDNTLHIKGMAPQSWINKAIDMAVIIPGVDQIVFDDLDISEGKKIDSLVNEIEDTYINFQFNTSSLLPGQQGKVKRVLELMKKLVKIANDKRIIIEIKGHTCSSGSEMRNEKLSWNRARKFLELIGHSGINEADFILKGFGNKSLLIEEKTEEDKKKNRRVSFDVIINNQDQ